MDLLHLTALNGALKPDADMDFLHPCGRAENRRDRESNVDIRINPTFVLHGAATCTGASRFMIWS